MKGWQAMDGLETAERVRLAALLASLRRLRGHGDAAPDEAALAPDEAGGSRGALPLDEAGGRALVWGLLGGGRLAATSLAGLLDQATAAFAAAPRVSDVFLENDADRCVVVGDLHGSLGDLVTACGLAGEPGPSTRVVFNGDFVDRGRDGVEVLGVVLALHLTFPEFVKVNRGNHEDTALSSAYDFEGELTRKYGRRAGAALLEQCGRLFAAMPVAALVRTVDGADSLVVHGGAPRGLPPVDALYAAPRATSVAAAHYGDGDAGDLLVQDLLWSDPVEYPSADFPETGAPNAARGGAGCVLYDGLLAPWLRRENLVRLVRSHETVATGAKVTDLGGGVERWTVFSASRYPHGTGLNKAAVLALSGDGAAAPSRWDHDRPESDPDGPAVGSTHVSPAALERDVGDDYEDVAVTRDALAARILAFLHRHRGALTLALDGEATFPDGADGLAPARPAARAPLAGVAAGFAPRSRAELRRVLGDDARGFAAFARAVGEVNATLPADRAIDAAAVWALLALADG
ncbi:manganese ion binding protein [Aureococcus anophagefferens]|uniref:Serine/threonine-protein phosphatase n=2 Tax=Aureococcus anophagefferens TaxID=44056 RepID=A0ABR1GGA2_AURAN